MSSTSSTSPVPDLVSESRKKGSESGSKNNFFLTNCSIGARGGKRSVTHLSKAQLARKRANDREAQRNIRQRTKEHICNLERKVKELEQSGRSSSIERVLKRNQDLESEIERLRTQLTSRVPVSDTTPIPSEMSEDLLLPQKTELNWIPSTSTWTNADIKNTSNNSYPSSEAPSYTHTSFDDESSQGFYPSNASPVWNDQPVFGTTSTQQLSKNTQAWAPYQNSYPPPSQYSSPVPSQNSNFSDYISSSTYAPSCWQNQPSIYAWQLSTKTKTPHTHMDQLMLSVNHTE